MKTTLSFVFAAVSGIASLQAQAGEPQVEAKVVACQAEKTCCTAAGNKVLAAFAALKPEAQKEVGEALTSLTKTCPIGSRMPQTLAALDRLYTDALANLQKIASNEKCEASLKDDLAQQIKVVTQLRDINCETITTIKTLSGAAKTSCCAEVSNGEAKATCCTEQKSDCCADGAANTTAVVFAENVTKSWASAQKDLEAAAGCKETQAKLAAGMETLKKHGIDLMPLLAGNMTKQAEMLQKACAVACPVNGLVAKHQDVMKACEVTNAACTTGVKDIVAAAQLMKALPFTKAGCCEAKGECTETPKGDVKN